MEKFMRKLIISSLGLVLGLVCVSCSDLEDFDTETDTSAEERGLITRQCIEKEGRSCTTKGGNEGIYGKQYDEKTEDCICFPISSQPHPNCGENQTCGESGGY